MGPRPGRPPSWASLCSGSISARVKDRPVDRPADETECHQRYSAAVRRSTLWWLLLAGSLLVLGVFHNPAAWDDGRLATLAVWAARLSGAIGVLGLVRSTRRVGEMVGVCVGMFACHPAQLGQRDRSEPT